jgi:hypothetical protein
VTTFLVEATAADHLDVHHLGLGITHVVAVVVSGVVPRVVFVMFLAFPGISLRSFGEIVEGFEFTSLSFVWKGIGVFFFIVFFRSSLSCSRSSFGGRKS